MTFTRAFIEERGNRKLRLEEQLVVAECERRLIPYVLYTKKRIQRRQLPLSRDCFICGDMDSMHGAMKQLGIDVPAPNDFPDCLSPYFHRRMWKSTVGGLFASMESSGLPVFAKPAGRCKVFTGQVFADPGDLYSISHISRQEPLWCAEIVTWVSEFRIYVVDTTILSVDHYAGDAGVKPDLSVVQSAVEAWRASAGAPVAYGIDFGVLDNGATALVEANDGFSLGAYRIDAAAYTDLLFARWRELVGTASAPTA